jgi:hypothetical protein
LFNNSWLLARTPCWMELSHFEFFKVSEQVKLTED